MLDKLDTILTRMIVLVLIAFVSALTIGFTYFQIRLSHNNPLPVPQFEQALESLAEISSPDWQIIPGPEELKQHHIDIFEISDNPLVLPNDTPFSKMVGRRLNLGPASPVGVEMRAFGEPYENLDRKNVNGTTKRMTVLISIKTETDKWVNFKSAPLTIEIPTSLFLVPLMIIFTATIVVVVWSASNATSPLNQMAQAANRLAADYEHNPLDETGPRDVREALSAFNRMGQRLETTVKSQHQLLAAIGHDLRTPITSLRLKAEMLQDENDRERFSRALTELERITEAALNASSAGQPTEPSRRLDLVSLVDSLCEDLRYTKLDVEFEFPDIRPLVLGRPDELNRAIRNIIENAVRYGYRARVNIEAAGNNRVEIMIDDDGPGISEKDLLRVFEPLVRLEDSRNKETGGHGLGLHIAKSVIEAHSGSITLLNRKDGGLRAVISLPTE